MNRRVGFSFICALLFATITTTPLFTSTVAYAHHTFRGWEFLVEQLRKENVSESDLKMVYQSRQMPRFENVPFALERKEPPDIYRVFFSEKHLKTAQKCLENHIELFKEAEETYKVSRFAVAAILLVETQCGRITGNRHVIYRLSRLASINDPENIRWNTKRLKKLEPNNPEITLERVEQRAGELYDIFFPEVVAFFRVIREKELKPFSLKGSIAGAFGISQFLPSSYLRYGRDGNADGRRNLFEHADAISSTAHYLQKFGWEDSLKREKKEKVIWAYNRSQPYIDTVLKVAKILEDRYASATKSLGTRDE